MIKEELQAENEAPFFIPPLCHPPTGGLTSPLIPNFGIGENIRKSRGFASENYFD